jgi:GT2 family glycosyltransferase
MPAGGTNNLAYRRAALEEVGGFDEGFRYAAGEDTDLKWRLCERGCTLLYVHVRAEHLQLYAWPNFKRQMLARGRGRALFELRRGKRLTRWTAALRMVKALIGLPRDLFVMPEPAFALAHWVELTWGAVGQWRELRTKSKKD